MEISAKRKRSKNWSSDEKHFLRALIEEQIDILEDKRIDSVTSSIKHKAWAYILRRFNEVNKNERSLAELRLQWKNTKLRRQAQYNRFCDAERQLEANLNAIEQKNDVAGKEEESSDIRFYLNTENGSSNFLEHEIKYEDISQDAASLPEKHENTYTDAQPMDEYYKRELFLIDKAVREKQLEYLKVEHEARMKSILMERELKLRFMEEEHFAKMNV